MNSNMDRQVETTENDHHESHHLRYYRLVPYLSLAVAQVIMNFNWKAINHQPVLPNDARWDHSRGGMGLTQQ